MIFKSTLLKVLFKSHCHKDTAAQATKAAFQSSYTHTPPMRKMYYGQKE